jgi:transketolase
MTVIVPADATETRQVIRTVADYMGPVYVRLARAATPVIFGEDYKFEIGKANVLREGQDITLVAMGLMVPHSLEAAKILEQQGIQCTVINSASVKPMDTATIKTHAAKTGRVMTVEEHSVIGGLGSAVAEVLAEEGKIPVHRYGVMDQFGQSGKASDLLKHYKLMPEDLAAEAKAFLDRSS